LRKCKRYEKVKKFSYRGSGSLREVYVKPIMESVKQRFAVPIFLLLISLILVSTARSDDLMKARVVAVADGDSITVLTPINEQLWIRLYGIDCPEIDQAFGMEAKQFTTDQCFGMTIQYRIVGIDRFDRTIATVYLDDGRELNLELLKAGLAWHLKRHADRKDYAEAEEAARSVGIGLWADKDPTPPWEWRWERRKN
jgi:endonuclease YncB( thermonuclease family)